MYENEWYGGEGVSDSYFAVACATRVGTLKLNEVWIKKLSQPFWYGFGSGKEYNVNLHLDPMFQMQGGKSKMLGSS